MFKKCSSQLLGPSEKVNNIEDDLLYPV